MYLISVLFLSSGSHILGFYFYLQEKRKAEALARAEKVAKLIIEGLEYEN